MPADSRDERTTTSRKLLWLGVLFAMFFWFLEALIHPAVFGEVSYMANLLPQNINELWMRTLVCSLLIVFGIYAQSTVAKLKASEDERLRLQGNALQAISIPQAQFHGASMIFLGLFGALTFWILESFIHGSMFYEGEFLENIFPKRCSSLSFRVSAFGGMAYIAARHGIYTNKLDIGFQLFPKESFGSARWNERQSRFCWALNSQNPIRLYGLHR